MAKQTARESDELKLSFAHFVSTVKYITLIEMRLIQTEKRIRTDRMT